LDGTEILYNFRELLGEPVGSAWLDTKSQYYFINRGAIKVVEKTTCLHGTQSITTVADQTNYNLDADFLGLHLKNDSGDWYIKYNDGSSNYFLPFAGYADVIADDNTSSVLIPSRFSINDASALLSQISSTTTSAGAATAGEATLTDTAATFVTSGVQPGDIVHNTTDASDGYVLTVTSETALVTALFNGTDNDYTSGDSYVIQPQPRRQLVLDPPPSTAGHTVTVYKITKPEPVYASYRMFRFNENYNMATIYFACALYKLRDQDPKKANDFFALGDNELREIKVSSDTEMHRRKSMRVNLKRPNR